MRSYASFAASAVAATPTDTTTNTTTMPSATQRPRWRVGASVRVPRTASTPTTSSRTKPPSAAPRRGEDGPSAEHREAQTARLWTRSSTATALPRRPAARLQAVGEVVVAGLRERFPSSEPADGHERGVEREQSHEQRGRQRGSAAAVDRVDEQRAERDAEPGGDAQSTADRGRPGDRGGQRRRGDAGHGDREVLVVTESGQGVRAERGEDADADRSTPARVDALDRECHPDEHEQRQGDVERADRESRRTGHLRLRRRTPPTRATMTMIRSVRLVVPGTREQLAPRPHPAPSTATPTSENTSSESLTVAATGRTVTRAA